MTTLRVGLVAAATAAALGMATAATAVPIEPDGTQTYIVSVTDGSVPAVAADLAELGITPEATFTHAIDGFSVELTAAQVAALSDAADVEAIAAEHAFAATDTQAPTPSWGLDRLDQDALPLSYGYGYDARAGAGVRVYVVDTGIAASPTLGARLAPGYTSIIDGNGTIDCAGHGTHVAGTVASTVFGVAKAATVVPVRVLDCFGDGDTSTVVAGLNWILGHHPAGTPGVVNMSLGGPMDAPINDAVAALTAAGITVVVAAGNDAVDACTASPASAPSAVTVGATTSTDARAWFSNVGPCLDVYAPGEGIVSLNFADAAAPTAHDGTSMASPHVAGIAALYLSRVPGATPAQVTAAILAAANPVVTDAGASTTTLLASSDVVPAPGMPSALSASAVTATGATVTWAPAAGGTPPTSYTLAWRAHGTSTWSTTTTALLGATLTGLTPVTTYDLSLTASDGHGVSSARTGALTTTTAPASLPTADETFIVAVYSDLFGRTPDPAGLATWTTALRTGTPRSAVSDAITSSAEYRSRLITGSYQTYLGRQPDPSGLAFWLAQMSAGMTIQTMEGGFIASDEYYGRAGGTPAGWVTQLYTDVLGRGAGASEVAFWVDALAHGASRQQVAAGFLLSDEHLATVIDAQYQHLLHRGIDPSGRYTWVHAIQTGSRLEQVIGSIIASQEYWNNHH